MGLFDIIVSWREHDTEKVSDVVLPKATFPKLEHLLRIGVPHLSKDRPFDNKFHPSEAGGCSRKMFFDRVTGPSSKGKPTWNTKLTFTHGDYVHEMLQTIMTAAAKELNVSFEVEKKLKDDEVNLVGSCDGFLVVEETFEVPFPKSVAVFPAGEFVVELKSCNLNSFEAIQAKPYDSHFMQVQLYMHMAGTDKAMILYYHKDSASVRQYDLMKDDEFIRGVLRRFKYVTRQVDVREVPMRYLSCDPTGDRINKKCAQYVTCKKSEAGKLVI